MVIQPYWKVGRNEICKERREQEKNCWPKGSKKIMCMIEKLKKKKISTLSPWCGDRKINPRGKLEELKPVAPWEQASVLDVGFILPFEFLNITCVKLHNF